MTPDEARQRAVEAAWGAFNHAALPTVRDDWTAAIAAFEAAMWQPIETCSDAVGDALFAWWDAEFSSWIIERCASWASSDLSEHQTAAEVAVDIGCTHWRPLPAGPGGGA